MAATPRPTSFRDRVTEAFAAAYKTKWKRTRQQALFPELEKEIEKEKERRQGATIFDQRSPAYADHVTKISGPLLGASLSPAQREKFETTILRPFAHCLWTHGCPTPRISNFQARIELKSDAVPRVQQPFRLSTYDQTRLEFHEDCEVEDGKAEWLAPGVAGQWGSPSFVVDQTGKGLLGRPVRDYRYPNSQTKDNPWPSPDAIGVLQRAQRGSLHSTLDCIWGFTQIEIDASTAELLQLVCRRGILRPKVLLFGAKQGP